MKHRTSNTANIVDEPAIRELTVHETQAVGGALSVSPNQISALAKLFTSVGGGTQTTGFAPRVKPPFSPF